MYSAAPGGSTNEVLSDGLERCGIGAWVARRCEGILGAVAQDHVRGGSYFSLSNTASYSYIPFASTLRCGSSLPPSSRFTLHVQQRKDMAKVQKARRWDQWPSSGRQTATGALQQTTLHRAVVRPVL